MVNGPPDAGIGASFAEPAAAYGLREDTDDAGGSNCLLEASTSFHSASGYDDVQYRGLFWPIRMARVTNS